MKQTLAQHRATKALLWKDRIKKGRSDGNVMSGFPMLIRTDGLLAALAYAIQPNEKEPCDQSPCPTSSPPGKCFGPKHGGENSIAQAIAEHLASLNVTKAAHAVALVTELAQASDASQLRRATAEAMAFLNYLKRFVA